MSDPTPTVWLDGALVAVADARISPFDHGILVGDGVFETLRVYDGVPFAWRRHHERLVHSATGLGLPTPDATTLRAAAEAVLEANGLAEARLRITVTGGPSPLGSERGSAAPTVVVAATEARPWAASEPVVTVPWPRNERGATAGLKTISYAENVRALAYAHEHDATEAIFLNTRGELCEATGSNVFTVVDGTVLTPPGDAGCLLGVTRALVLELCDELGIRAAEQRARGRCARDRRRGVPHVEHTRGAADLGGRRSRTPGARPDDRTARRRVHRPRRPRPRPLRRFASGHAWPNRRADTDAPRRGGQAGRTCTTSPTATVVRAPPACSSSRRPPSSTSTAVPSSTRSPRSTRTDRPSVTSRWR